MICGSCHRSHHEGTLTITGTAEHLDVRRPGQAISIVELGAHAGAPGALTEEIQPGAHAGAPIALTEEIQPGAHAGAPIALIEEIQPGARMGAPVGTSPEVEDRAPVEPVLLDHPGVREEPKSQLEVAVRRAQTKDALVRLGWKPAIASAAVATAWARVGSHATLEHLICEALRQCPRPSATVERVPQAP